MRKCPVPLERCSSLVNQQPVTALTRHGMNSSIGTPTKICREADVPTIRGAEFFETPTHHERWDGTDEWYLPETSSRITRLQCITMVASPPSSLAFRRPLVVHDQSCVRHHQAGHPKRWGLPHVAGRQPETGRRRETVNLVSGGRTRRSFHIP